MLGFRCDHILATNLGRPPPTEPDSGEDYERQLMGDDPPKSGTAPERRMWID
jgi:hypothetical protein